jgi:hypothetical protein
VPLLELHADTSFSAPNDMTAAAAIIALDPQDELLGKPERGFKLDCRAGFGQAANGAWDAGRAKFDCASQQDPMAGRDAVFFDSGGLETRRGAPR